MFENLQLVSITLEAIIAILFLSVALRGRTYMYGLTVTFAIYVWYDLARFMAWEVDPGLQAGVFFAATLAALYSAWCLYKQR